MFPLTERKLIRGCKAHVAAGLGCGADYIANYVDLLAPFEGKVETYFGEQGGYWLRLIRPNGDRIEFAHLQKYLVSNGNEVKAGKLIAHTGNTGAITTGPHLHVQIFRDSKRLDPEKYNWEDAILPPMTCEELLAKEKIEHKEDIVQKELNYQNWQTQLTRANTLENQLAIEIDGHKQTLEQLETARAEVTKLEAEMKLNQTKIDQIKGIVL